MRILSGTAIHDLKRADKLVAIWTISTQRITIVLSMRIGLFCFFTLALLFATACQRAAAPISVSNKPVSINDVPQKNVPMPPTKPLNEMIWTLAGGGEQTLKNHAGKVVILDFWATYCRPCREEIPHLNSILAKHGPDNIVIIGLNVGGDEDLALVPEFTKQTKINYPIAVPEDALNDFIFSETTSIPQTAVFDRTGRLVKKFVGYGPTVKDELDRVVETALSATAPL